MKPLITRAQETTMLLGGDWHYFRDSRHVIGPIHIRRDSPNLPEGHIVVQLAKNLFKVDSRLDAVLIHHSYHDNHCTVHIHAHLLNWRWEGPGDKAEAVLDLQSRWFRSRAFKLFITALSSGSGRSTLCACTCSSGMGTNTVLIQNENFAQ